MNQTVFNNHRYTLKAIASYYSDGRGRVAAGDDRMVEVLVALDVARPRMAGDQGALGGARSVSAGQAERRAIILAAARALFNEGGPAVLTVRRLVARSGVTAPTIYSLIGNRDAVLERALLDHHDGCIALAPLVARRDDLNVANGFAETLWLSGQVQPLYMRRQIQLMWRGTEGRRLARMFTDRTIAAMTLWLRDLCGRSRLARRVGHETLAAAVEAQVRVALLDWADGFDSALTLRRKLARATSIPLIRFVDEEISGRMARWMEELDGAR